MKLKQFGDYEATYRRTFCKNNKLNKDTIPQLIILSENLLKKFQ